MKEIVNRLHENRQIELAKAILENAGYTVTKEVNESSNNVSTGLKRKRLQYLHNSGSNATDHIESLSNKYQPDARHLDDLSDETIEKVYADLVNKYKEDISRYGDDNEVPAEAFKVLDLE